MKAKLTLQIKVTNHKLGKSKVDTTKYRYLLAEKLMALAENMGTETEKTKIGRKFYTYLLLHFTKLPAKIQHNRFNPNP
jgi:hypothetical protein